LSLALMLAVALTRSITPGAAGPNRLDVDVALLAGAKPNTLADLRLHDAKGAEVPYLLIEPPERTPAWKSGRILPIASTKKTSGFEADFGAVTKLDRIAIEGIGAPFLKRLKLEGGGDRTRWTLLAAEATVFDLPEEKLKNLEVAFEAGEYRYLRVTWDDASSARVRSVGGVRARVHDSGSPPAPMAFTVPYRAVAGERGKSRYRLTLPGPHLPVAAIALQVSNANVDRAASVSEPRLAGNTVGPVELGASTLRRAQRDGGVAEDMEIEINAPEGPDLDLTVDNGSNPPLAIRAIVARLAPQPWIYFESADGAPLTATFGNPMLDAPRYDLEASRRGIASTKVALAKWSAGVPPAGPAASRRQDIPPGAPVDRKAFRYSRTIGAMQRGLTSLVLDAHVLANSAALNDLRLTDAKGNQVPYLVERRESPLAIRLAIPQRVAGEEQTSRYRFTLPFDALPAGSQLVLRTGARVFERRATLRKPPDESHGREAVIVESSEWRSSEPEADPPPLTFTAPERGARSLELEIDEGDNAPLPLVSAELLLPSYALRFVSPGTPLTLLYGNPGAAPPRYDLALLAPRLFGESSREVTLASVPPAEGSDGASRERKIFWVVIGAAAVVLLLTLTRLLSGVSAPTAG
jgi:Protein of unknown function (DUF3999)